MKTLSLFLLTFVCSIFFACESEKDVPYTIDGLTVENYPKVDASTSLAPLQTLMACKLLGLRYYWQEALHWDGTYSIAPVHEDIPEGFMDRLATSGTHNAYMNLIDKKVDFILTARTLSEDEKKHAGELGVNLIETPVALDAFIFILNPDNPVKSLTTKQIQGIYTGEITNWSEVGGSNSRIRPYIREANSGSQELMESLVMKGVDMIDWPEDVLSGMAGPFITLRTDVDGICYTVYYYKEMIVRRDIVQKIAVDGVYPDGKTIKNRSYPYTTEVYAVIRSDESHSSMAYKLYESLQTEAGRNVIAESGYIPD